MRAIGQSRGRGGLYVNNMVMIGRERQTNSHVSKDVKDTHEGPTFPVQKPDAGWLPPHLQARFEWSVFQRLS